MSPMPILIIGVLTILTIRVCPKLSCIEPTNEFWICIIRGIRIRVIVNIIKIVQRTMLVLNAGVKNRNDYSVPSQ